MNSKHLKLLRKALQFHPAQPRDYVTKTVKTVAVDTGKLDGKGNAIMRFEQRNNVQATGLRKAYQDAKRHIAKGVL